VWREVVTFFCRGQRQQLPVIGVSTPSLPTPPGAEPFVPSADGPPESSTSLVLPGQSYSVQPTRPALTHWQLPLHRAAPCSMLQRCAARVSSRTTIMTRACVPALLRPRVPPAAARRARCVGPRVQRGRLGVNRHAPASQLAPAATPGADAPGHTRLQLPAMPGPSEAKQRCPQTSSTTLPMAHP
jgi:hypothetical protein